MPKKSITIIGSSGYIGGYLSNYLRDNQYSVITPQRGDENIFQADLGKIIYCAGMTADFRFKPFETIDSHITLLRKLLEVGKFSSLLYLSSTRVYQGLAEGKEDSNILIDPTDPEYLYNLTKLTGESLCRASGRDCVRIARLSNVVGPKLWKHEHTFIGSLIASARKGHIHLEGNPSSEKDYISVNDVARYLTLISESGKSTLYNVGSGVQTKNIEWVRYISDKYKCTYSCSSMEPIQSFPPISVQQIQAEFGKLHTSFFDGCDL